VRQYRHGTQCVTLEIPGGLLEPGDTPETAAIRELYEETGYKAWGLINLGNVHPNPAIQNNRCYTYLAKDVFPCGGQNQDEKEDIEVVLKPLADIPRFSTALVSFYRSAQCSDHLYQRDRGIYAGSPQLVL